MSTLPVLHNLPQWIDKPVQKRRSRRQQRHLKWAIQQAFQNFAEQQPRWANSLFDEYFLVKTLTSGAVDAKQPARLPTADELTVAWAAQFNLSDPFSGGVQYNMVRTIAAEFLAHLELVCEKINL